MINFKSMSENVWQSRSIQLHSDLSWSIYKEHLNLDRIYSSYEVELDDLKSSDEELL